MYLFYFCDQRGSYFQKVPIVKKPHIVGVYLYEMSRISESTETVDWQAVARGREESNEK